VKSVLIFGSGSIGNHMAFACRKNKMQVYVTDISKKALNRMREEIYPRRYGSWDNKINLTDYSDLKKIKKNFDLIIIGTPPKTHIKIYNYCREKLSYKKILIEKPISNFLDKNLKTFKKNIKKDLVFSGYNHSISPSFKYFFKNIFKNKQIKKIEVSWCEAWDGILNAHFWLKNQSESYLGDYKKGGGALQEHSHGLHLLFLILNKLNINLNKVKLANNFIFSKSGQKKYDLFANFLGFHNNTYFSYKTDLITFPAEKKITVLCSNKKYEWICNYLKNHDLVRITSNNKAINLKKFKKTRSSEFENEIKHIMKTNSILQRNKSNLNPTYAVDTINLIKKLFKK
jgi:predicted dehydrogenase